MKQIIFQCGDEVLEYHPHFFSEDWKSKILDEVEFTQNQVKIFGKVHSEPRLTAWFGPPYKYSGIAWPRKDLPTCLSSLSAKLATHFKFNFNSVLCNYYRSGLDSMGWHSDDEPEIDSSVIASISFGAARIARFRHKKTKEKIEIVLEGGSLLIMKNFQSGWQHSIPKMMRLSEPRLNLTFRKTRNTCRK